MDLIDRIAMSVIEGRQNWKTWREKLKEINHDYFNVMAHLYVAEKEEQCLTQSSD